MRLSVTKDSATQQTSATADGESKNEELVDDNAIMCVYLLEKH